MSNIPHGGLYCGLKNAKMSVSIYRKEMSEGIMDRIERDKRWENGDGYNCYIITISYNIKYHN